MSLSILSNSFLRDSFFSSFFSRGVLRYFTQTWWNNSFWCLLQRLPKPQDVIHLCLRYCKFLTLFLISIAVLKNGPLTQGYR
jgi:hypothetical protein